MHIQKHNFQTIKYLFYILMAAILGWFLFMQIFGADEQKYNNPSESILPQHFQKIMIKLLLRFVLLYKTLNFM